MFEMFEAHSLDLSDLSMSQEEKNDDKIISNYKRRYQKKYDGKQGLLNLNLEIIIRTF